MPIKVTDGARRVHVELPILRCLANGDWKQPGEIKDFVARHGRLPSGAKSSLKNRSAEAQSNNAVQNCISSSRARSLTAQGLIEYDSFKGAYRIVELGRSRRAELEMIERIADEVLSGE